MSAVVKSEGIANIIESVVVDGNLARLNTEQRLSYYKAVCESVGLNPLTKPFDYITLNGKLTLYARKDATDQLRNIHQVSIAIAAREMVDDCYVVTARATNKNGRTDESIGAVSVGSLKGEAKCNAIMKAETKAKRRVTLSICGLGMLDELEIETIPANAVKGEIEVTTEAKVYTRPKSEDTDSTAKTAQAVPVQSPSPEPPSSDVQEAECIGSGMAANLHKTFRQALKPAYQKDSEKLLHDWLKVQGIEKTLDIRKDSFADVREAAVEHARSL